MLASCLFPYVGLGACSSTLALRAYQSSKPRHAGVVEQCKDENRIHKFRAILESLHPAHSRYPTRSYGCSVPKARDPSNTGRDQGIVDTNMQIVTVWDV